MKPRYHDDMTLDVIMKEWPETVGVILKHGLLCVGCPIAPFHTITEAAQEHNINEATLLRELTAVMG